MRKHKHPKRIYSRHPSWLGFVDYGDKNFETFMNAVNTEARAKSPARVLEYQNGGDRKNVFGF